MTSVQRSNSLPDLGAAAQPPGTKGAAALKGWLPLLDRRSYIYGVGCETVRRNEVVENLNRFRAEGNLPKLWAAVRRAQLDVHLAETPAVLDAKNVLARATKLKHICENVARRTARGSFTTKDVRVLETAVKELKELNLGPKMWKDTMYPVLQYIPHLLPHLEKLRELAQEHRTGMKPGCGCARYCAAWLEAVGSGELQLRFPMEAAQSDFQDEVEKTSALEVSTGRWLLGFPDALVELGLLVSDDVKAEYWRLTDSMEGTSSEPEGAAPVGLSPEDAHLARILVLAGSLGNESPQSDEQPPKDEQRDGPAADDAAAAKNLHKRVKSASKSSKLGKSTGRKPVGEDAEVRIEDAEENNKPRSRKAVEDVKLT